MWCRFLRRAGLDVDLAVTQTDAFQALERHAYDALIIEPALSDGGGLPVSDLATYRNPGIAILAVTKSSFFSDGSIFGLIPNARGFLRTPVRPGDLMAYLEYCTSRGRSEERQLA